MLLKTFMRTSLNTLDTSDIPYWFDGTFNRGYTGHEHIDELGLININGRMYDPRLGRFYKTGMVSDPDNIISVGPNIMDNRSWLWKNGHNQWYTHAGDENVWTEKLSVNYTRVKTIVR